MAVRAAANAASRPANDDARRLRSGSTTRTMATVTAIPVRIHPVASTVVMVGGLRQAPGRLIVVRALPAAGPR
ncbi:hypothetical protein GA0070606_1251 [Micromonospora citrea]|uniref:Uncharacterized protein n=1 Tax=Micromonospora citrea TaxID=47855 RepID=A0A1C6U2B8_9ACTN|nr:hypothetical protein GA0070606_1251 [Micromonospora citrea]